MRRVHRTVHRRVWLALSALLPLALLAAWLHRAPAPAEGAVRLSPPGAFDAQGSRP